MFAILTSAVALSLVIAYFGRNRKIGFWGMLFGSILLTPLMGLIILLVTDDVPKNKNKNKDKDKV